MAGDELKEEPIVDRLRSKPGEAPSGLVSYVGLLGRSPKPDSVRLYPNLDMGRSVDIAKSDIVHAEKLSPEKSPFGSLGGTRVFVKPDAQVTHTATHTQKASEAVPDEFDLDIRHGAAPETRIERGHTWRCWMSWGPCGTPNPDQTIGPCAH
jgi:hypothetical protein